jgi:hypothetical protein
MITTAARGNERRAVMSRSKLLRAISTLSAVALASILCAVPLGGSVPNQAGAAPQGNIPLHVQIVTEEGEEGTVARWKVANVSGKDVIAYCVVVRCPEQREGCNLVHTTVAGMVSKPPGDRLRAGEVRDHRAGVPPGSGVWIPSVDYVLFADGSAWGPDTMKRSLYIEGVIKARRGIYVRLKHVLETEGVQALVDEVQTGLPFP